MARGEELTHIQKRFLVQQLACFETPTSAAKAFKEEFGFELQRSRVSYYDPTTKFGAGLAEDLRHLFDSTREKFKADLESIPIANRAVRLKHLQRQLDHFSGLNAAPIVLSLVEAAAKEVGGAFTNKHKHEHTGKDGKDLPPNNAVVTIIALPDNGRG